MATPDHVAVITGGSRGIGRAIAEKYLENGWRVALLDLAPGEAGWPEERAMLFFCDVTSKESVIAAKDHVLEVYGHVDALVNNAGWISPGRDKLEDYSEAYWRKVMDINVNGVFFTTQVFGAVMIAAGGGAIVNLSSIGASHPIPGSGAYCPSKAAVTALTKLTALEWSKYHIRANAVCPGQILTDMTRKRFEDPEFAKARTDVIPAGKVGTARDVAAACFFLTSEEATYITGETLLVDGGLALNTLAVLGNN